MLSNPLSQRTLAEDLLRSSADYVSATPAQPGVVPLRIGVVLPSNRVPAWICKILRDLSDSNFLTLDLVGIERGARESSNTVWETLLSKLWKRLFKTQTSAFELLDIGGFIEQGAESYLESVELGETDLAKLKCANLDVLLYFGSKPISCALTQCARFGVWCFPGAENQFRNLQSLRAAYTRNPVFETVLEVFSEEFSGSKVIYRSFSATNFILYTDQNSTYWKTANFAIRRLYDLHRFGWEQLKSLASPDRVEDQTISVVPLPGPRLAHFLVRWLKDAIEYKITGKFWEEQWFVAFRRVRDEIPTSTQAMSGFAVLRPPRDRFYADPFVISRNGRHYIFFEEFEYKKGKGVISCVEIEGDGEFSRPEVVLEKSYHLSYPCLFEWQGELYLVPETHQNHTIEVYRAVDFPRAWTLERVLLQNVTAVDPTIFVHAGKLWLFAGGMVQGASLNDELFLFHAESLFGEWVRHPKSPIVSDVRRARPAGQLFFHNGQLIRPSQDCSQRYGRAVSLNRVDALSESDYAEVPIATIEPDWFPGNYGTHTFNQNEHFQVVDGRTLIRK